MESDTFYSGDIYDHFAEEFLWYNNGNINWDEFLESKDLGIKYLGSNKYLIEDKNKWFLGKIKYGF